MLQIVDFSSELERRIEKLEEECIEITGRLEQCYRSFFESYGMKIIIELVRTRDGKNVSKPSVFSDNYQSFIEIALEDENEEYFPNAYIPIWKCKKELFYPVGYLTKWDTKVIEKKIKLILHDMLRERMEDLQNIKC